MCRNSLAIPQSLQDVHLFVHFIEDMSILREVTSCPFLLKGSAEGIECQV